LKKRRNDSIISIRRKRFCQEITGGK